MTGPVPASFPHRAAMLAPLLLAALAAAPADSAENTPDVTVLFDGSSLDAWEKYPAGPVPDGWSIDGDALRFAGKGGGDIQTKEAFTDFDLRFEWKVSPGANSGVMYGVRPDPNAPPYTTGPEYQVLDDERHPDGKNIKNRAAALYALQESRPFKVCPVDGSKRCPHVTKTLKAVGEWNSGRIVKDGDSLRHYLNGEKVTDITLGSDEWDAAIADSKFASWDNFAGPLLAGEAGRIALQDHGDEVWFRNITVRPPAAGGGEDGAGDRSVSRAAPRSSEPQIETATRSAAPASVTPGAAADEAAGGEEAGATAEGPADGTWAAFLARPTDNPGVTGEALVNGSDWAAFLGRE